MALKIQQTDSLLAPPATRDSYSESESAATDYTHSAVGSGGLVSGLVRKKMTHLGELRNVRNVLYSKILVGTGRL